MFPVTTKQGGTCDAFPDTSKTPAPPGPPVPMPYGNSGNMVQANPATCSKRLRVLNQPAAMLNTMIPTSMGDEPGSAGGVVSGMIKGPVTIKKGSAKVKVEGQPLAYQTCTTGQNGTNANAPMGIQSSPSQGKVLVAG